MLQGKVELTNVHTNETCTLTQGDSIYLYNGSRMKWNIIHDMIKVFYGYKDDGF
jgi:uncharacterized cupin superfamily protein